MNESLAWQCGEASGDHTASAEIRRSINEESNLAHLSSEEKMK
jgi:hypothetical protein